MDLSGLGCLRRNNSVGFHHEKHETHEMMKFGKRRCHSIATLKSELQEDWFLSRCYCFRVFSVFRGDLWLHCSGLDGNRLGLSLQVAFAPDLQFFHNAQQVLAPGRHAIFHPRRMAAGYRPADDTVGL
jgi:hypothetical protein